VRLSHIYYKNRTRTRKKYSAKKTKKVKKKHDTKTHIQRINYEINTSATQYRNHRLIAFDM